MEYTVQIRDSKNQPIHTLKLSLPDFTLVITTKDFGQRFQKHRQEATRKKRIPVLEVTSWLEQNGIYSEYKVRSFQTFRKDGFDIEIPSVIQIVTDVTDDRPLPSQDTEPVDPRLRAIAQMAKILSLYMR